MNTVLPLRSLRTVVIVLVPVMRKYQALGASLNTIVHASGKMGEIEDAFGKWKFCKETFLLEYPVFQLRNVDVTSFDIG